MIQIANLSDAQFETLVVRMLKDLTENGKSIREETKAVLREIKKIPVGNQQRREASRIQISDLEHKEEINIQPKQNE